MHRVYFANNSRKHGVNIVNGQSKWAREKNFLLNDWRLWVDECWWLLGVWVHDSHVWLPWVNGSCIAMLCDRVPLNGSFQKTLPKSLPMVVTLPASWRPKDRLKIQGKRVQYASDICFLQTGVPHGFIFKQDHYHMMIFGSRTYMVIVLILCLILGLELV